MGVRTWIEGWPVYRQLADGDALGRGAAAKSPASARRVARTVSADKVVKSECPYGSASLQLTTGPARQYRVLYRRPFGTEWEHLDLDTAMDMIADRVIKARNHGWQWEQDGVRTRRTLGFASLGGAAATPKGSRSPPTCSSPMTGRPPAAAGSTAGSPPTGSTKRPGASRAASRTGWPPNGAGPGRPTGGILYNRASADPDGKPWSERKALVWWDAGKERWTGHDIPDFPPDKAPSYRPPDDATGPDGLSGADPFIMQAGGKAWLFAPAGLVDGPLPVHYEPQESPFRNVLYGQQRNPVRQVTGFDQPGNRLQPSEGEPGAEVFPYVATTYRLTEHHTAGGMSRWLPYLSELQPELFCEVSPELPAERDLEHLGWATIVTARGDRGPGAGHRPDGHAHRGRPPAAPGGAALPLGQQRAQPW